MSNLKSKEEIIKDFEYAEQTEEVIESNEIKKGDSIREVNGWYGEIMDNMRGNIRVASIHGFFSECGSIYVWDIDVVVHNGKVYHIKLTDKQIKNKEMTNIMGL